MKAIIAAGGSGTRLRPLTFSSNKHMLPIANKPLILYPIEAIARVGIKEVGVIVNDTRPAIENLLGDGSNWGLKITYINQEKPLGLAHVVKIAQPFLGDSPFVYHLGDNIFSQGIERPFKKFVETKADALLTLIKHKENYRLGVPYFDEQGNLVKVVEKPKNPPNSFGVPGLYFFTPTVFNAFNGHNAIKPSARGELEVTDLYTYLLSNGYKVESEQVDGRWMDPGKFDDMLDASAFMLDLKTQSELVGTIDNNSQIEGIIEIGQETNISNSRLVGPISIGKNVKITNCRLGPHVTVEDECQLENLTMSNSIVMSQTIIKNIKNQIVDSMIGKKAEIFSDANQSNSLFIGDHCQVRVS